MGISSVGSKIGEYAAKGIGKATAPQAVRNMCEKFYKDPIKYAGYATLASLATKDAVGCYLYVTQSLNNKKIPEEKRRFVANMDLTNGILNVITQIGLTFGVKKLYTPLFNKALNKSFNSKAIKRAITEYRKDCKKLGFDPIRKLEAQEKLDKLKKNAFSAFSAVTDIVVAAIIAKRCVVPFLSTPITQYFTNKHNEKLEKLNKTAKTDSNTETKESADVKPENESSIAKAPDTKNSSFSGSTNLLAKFNN